MHDLCMYRSAPTAVDCPPPLLHVSCGFGGSSASCSTHRPFIVLWDLPKRVSGRLRSSRNYCSLAQASSPSGSCRHVKSAGGKTASEGKRWTEAGGERVKDLWVLQGSALLTGLLSLKSLNQLGELSKVTHLSPHALPHQLAQPTATSPFARLRPSKCSSGHLVRARSFHSYCVPGHSVFVSTLFPT